LKKLNTPPSPSSTTSISPFRQKSNSNILTKIKICFLILNLFFKVNSNPLQSYNKDDKLIQNEEIVFAKHVRIGGSAYLAGIIKLKNSQFNTFKLKIS